MSPERKTTIRRAAAGVAIAGAVMGAAEAQPNLHQETGINLTAVSRPLESGSCKPESRTKVLCSPSGLEVFVTPKGRIEAKFSGTTIPVTSDEITRTPTQTIFEISRDMDTRDVIATYDANELNPNQLVLKAVDVKQPGSHPVE